MPEYADITTTQELRKLPRIADTSCVKTAFRLYTADLSIRLRLARVGPLVLSKSVLVRRNRGPPLRLSSHTPLAASTARSAATSVSPILRSVSYRVRLQASDTWRATSRCNREISDAQRCSHLASAFAIKRFTRSSACASACASALACECDRVSPKAPQITQEFDAQL